MAAISSWFITRKKYIYKTYLSVVSRYGKFRNKHDVVDGEEAEEGYGWNDESRNLLDAKPANDLKDWDNSEEQVK